MGAHLKNNSGKLYHKFIWKFKDCVKVVDKPSCEFKVLDKYPHYEIYEDGTIWSNHTRSNKPLVPRDQDGYKRVELTESGKPVTQLLHRLVATAFLDRPDGCNYVNHLDNNPSNNHVSNLKWCTQSENMLRAHKNGNKSSESRSVHHFIGDALIEFRSLSQAGKYVGKESTRSLSTTEQL